MSSDKSKIHISGQKITDIFSGDKTYKVPIFQRKYVWKEQQWDDLWEDVVVAKEHYIGAFVLQKKGNRELSEQFEIIDGQQRLVTIGLIAAAAIEVLRSTFKVDEAKGYAEEIKHMFIVNSNGDSKLKLWGENRKFWNSEVVRKDLAIRGKESSSQKQMTKALEFFVRRLKKTDFNTPAKIHRLLTHAVGDCMICSRVVTADKSDAHAIFATLNGKGRALSPTELILNYFLSTADDKKEERQIREQWDSISNIINNKQGKNDEMINFVRAFYNYRYGFSSRSQLYRAIVSCISDGKEMRKFMDGMKHQARFYTQLRSPEQADWDNDSFNKVDVLRMLRVQRYSLLMSIQESLQDSLPVALHICAAIGIRHEICGVDMRLIEKIYHRAARNIHKGIIQSTQDMFDFLKQKGAYPSDLQFKERFALYTANFDRSRADAPKLQYLLKTIEEHLGNEDVDPDHLYRFDSWGGDTAHSHRLGNHVFWEFGANPSSKTLADSIYQTTKMLADTIQQEGKTPQAIVTHQKQLADIAAKVASWRFDLSQGQDD